jgi:hypothetical protein
MVFILFSRLTHLRQYNAITRRPSPLSFLAHFIVYIIFGLDENWDLAEGQLVLVHDCVTLRVIMGLSGLIYY